MRLKETLSLDEAIEAPGAGDTDRTATDVGAALGQLLSSLVRDNMAVGVGRGGR